jgi:SagB-type dehydrogenase family enzyme
MANSKAPLFKLFWENSKLNSRRIFKFAENLQQDAAQGSSLQQLIFSGADFCLKKPKDKLAKIFLNRSSQRDFSQSPLSVKHLSGLFYAFAGRGQGLRVNASAGGKYPVEVFAFLFNVKSDFGGKIVYYNSDTHSLSSLGPCPAWEDIRTFINFESVSAPAVAFFFVGFPDRISDKYGERGGRFLLLECGGMMQSLGLRAAHQNIKGVLVGGCFDDNILLLLNLNDPNAILVGAYLCGN